MSKTSSYNNDFYLLKARREGIRARSYYKLEEIDRKFDIFSHLKRSDWILDLGCSPGSWVQYVLKVTGGRAHVVGVDLKKTEYFPDYPRNFHFVQEDINQLDESSLSIVIENHKFSVVMSDMAPDTSGNHERDSYLSYELVLRSWEIAKETLISEYSSSQNRRGGVFIAKYFEGEESADLLRKIRIEAKQLTSSLFLLGRVKLFKPNASRKNSREIYIVVR